MTKTLSLIAAALTLSTLSACSSSASLVRKDAGGGRVAIAGAYMPAMGEARALMFEHCHGRFHAEELGDSLEFRCGRAPSTPAAAEQLVARASGTGGL